MAWAIHLQRNRASVKGTEHIHERIPEAKPWSWASDIPARLAGLAMVVAVVGVGADDVVA